MERSTLHDFATRYTAAWCSQDAPSVAAFFAPDGSLTINQGAPAVGRKAITASAQSFMSAFPDLVVRMDRIVQGGQEGSGRATYHWTLIGTNTGAGGTGNPVRISGSEEWRLDASGFIAESQGQFDEADYRRQISGG